MKINEENLDQHIKTLNDTGVLRVSNFLDEAFADKIYRCLTEEVKWGLSCKLSREDKDGQVFLDANDTSDLTMLEQKKIRNLQKMDDFQYIYNTYMMVTAYMEKRDPDLYLHKVLEWLNTINTHHYFKQLTQNYKIKKINAQATRYLPGHYLTQHSDIHKGEGRLYAMILGFSKNWNPDWGGLLHVMNSDGKIVETLIPEYNSLSLFKVPKDHFVSMVTPLAKTQRLALTGWLLSN